jgi:hypothetical protein
VAESEAVMTTNKAEIDLSFVVCKDCTPVFYEAGGVPHAKPGALVLKWVALCQRHAAAPLLGQAAIAAYFLCESLLAIREGATDELIREIRDALKESIKQAGLELRP